MIESILQPWPWYSSGLAIAFVMFLLLWNSGEFGVSGNLRTLCSIGGAGKFSSFFRFDWKSQIWNLVFVVGMIIGGFLAAQYMHLETPKLNPATAAELNNLGLADPSGLLPQEIFSFEGLMTPKGFVIMALGGFLVGFGARYAGGCTSGHAIAGLANLQWPSLVAVIGFFIGGLLMNWLVLPWILTL